VGCGESTALHHLEDDPTSIQGEVKERLRMPVERESLSVRMISDTTTFSLDSRVTGATRVCRFHDVVKDVDLARVLAGFHFRNSDLEGSNLGRKVGGYVVDHFFGPTA
jgi:hypothetical protein